jgi:hypothetical protein
LNFEHLNLFRIWCLGFHLFPFSGILYLSTAMRSWKLEVGRRSRSRAAVIAGAVLASAFASVLLVSAQSSLKPPCNQFTDPNCHPAPPVVTAKASQTVAGDVNVTGKLCVGAAPGQVCFGGTAGGGAVPDSVSSGTLTVFQKAIDFTDRVGTEQPAKFNVRTFLQEKTGVDPGAVKAVVIRAEMFGGQNPNYYGAYYQEHAGRFWAAPAGVNLLNVDDLNADVYMVVRML